MKDSFIFEWKLVKGVAFPVSCCDSLPQNTFERNTVNQLLISTTGPKLTKALETWSWPKFWNFLSAPVHCWQESLNLMDNLGKPVHFGIFLQRNFLDKLALITNRSKQWFVRTRNHSLILPFNPEVKSSLDRLLKLRERPWLPSIWPICQFVTQSIIEIFNKQLFRRHLPPLVTPFQCFAKISTYLHRPRTAVSKEKAFAGLRFCQLVGRKPGNQIACGAIWGFNWQQSFLEFKKLRKLGNTFWRL